jgi:hypothetical protein
MNKFEIDRTIERLKAVFTFHSLGDDRTNAEYKKILKNLDYKQTDTAIDALMLIDSRNLPPISELIKAVKEVQKKSATFVTNTDHCPICNNTGYVLYTQKLEAYNNLPTQYAAHCICELGQSLSYDGRTVKEREHASPYGVQSITQYFDDTTIKQIAKSNKISAEEKQRIRQQIAKLGLKMPELKEVAPWE